MAPTALVTGGTGFYGANLCERLLAEGWQVHATTRRVIPRSESLPKFHVADLQDMDAAERLLDSVEPDVVFHLSGSASAAVDVDLVLTTHHSQVTSAVNLLTIATRRSLQRLVLIGSLMEPVGDIEEAIPSSPYSASKLAVTSYGRMFHRMFDCPAVIVRPYMTFGPRQAAGHVLPYVIRTLATGDAPQLSSGNWRTDWIYIDDVIDGLVLAGTHPGIDGEIIELGRGELRSVREMVTRIYEIMGTGRPPEFGVRDDRPHEPVRRADPAMTRKLIAWEPSTEIDDGLRRTIEWYSDRS